MRFVLPAVPSPTTTHLIPGDLELRRLFSSFSKSRQRKMWDDEKKSINNIYMCKKHA